MLQDFKYAVKVIHCLFSKYIELQQPAPCQCGDDENCECPAWEPALDEIPFYVCPVFSNRRHIPLPLVVGNEDSYCGPLQGLALRFAEWCAFYTPFFKDYMCAFIDCSNYEYNHK